MLTRRTLFARLSAVALAPLVKLLPKEEASRMPTRSDWVSFTTPNTPEAIYDQTIPVLGESGGFVVCSEDKCWFVDGQGGFWPMQNLPVPQEEA